jgi:hypothetical protein
LLGRVSPDVRKARPRDRFGFRVYRVRVAVTAPEASPSERGPTSWSRGILTHLTVERLALRALPPTFREPRRRPEEPFSPLWIQQATVMPASQA